MKKMIVTSLIIPFLIIACLASQLQADDKPEKGNIIITADEKEHVPEMFRLSGSRHEYLLTRKYHLRYSEVLIASLQFASPLRSKHDANNTVYCEYYTPAKPGKFPAVIVLDILDGQQVVSRSEALWLAQHDIAVLVVTMAYYGPRQPKNARGEDLKIRMLSTDIKQSVINVQQSVLDCRCALAWLRNRPEVQADSLGVLGTSLGSFVGALVASADPHVTHASLLLGGGGLVDEFLKHPQAERYVPVLKLLGITPEHLHRWVDPIDPLTYAAYLKKKKLLLVAARYDDVVPPKAMENLWRATDKPRLLWVESNHVGAAGYMFTIMQAVHAHITQRK